MLLSPQARTQESEASALDRTRGAVASSRAQTEQLMIERGLEGLAARNPRLADLIEDERRLEVRLSLSVGTKGNAQTREELRPLLAQTKQKIKEMIGSDRNLQATRELLYKSTERNTSNWESDYRADVAREHARVGSADGKAQALESECRVLYNLQKELAADGVTATKASELIDQAAPRLSVRTKESLSSVRERLTSAMKSTVVKGLSVGKGALRSSGGVAASLLISTAVSEPEDRTIRGLLKGECPIMIGFLIPTDAITGFISLSGEEQEKVLGDCQKRGHLENFLKQVKKFQSDGTKKVVAKIYPNVTCMNRGGIAVITSKNEFGQVIRYLYDNEKFISAEVARQTGGGFL